MNREDTLLAFHLLAHEFGAPRRAITFVSGADTFFGPDVTAQADADGVELTLLPSITLNPSFFRAKGSINIRRFRFAEGSQDLIRAEHRCQAIRIPRA